MCELPKHPYPTSAWLSMAQGRESPDSRVAVDRTVLVPDLTSLHFEYPALYASSAPAEALKLALEDAGDFCVGGSPELKRVDATGDPSSGRASIHAEWVLAVGVAVYREATRTLYICVRDATGDAVIRRSK